MSYEVESHMAADIINDIIVYKLIPMELVEKYPFRVLVTVLDKLVKHPEYLNERARRLRVKVLKMRPIEEFPELYI